MTLDVDRILGWSFPDLVQTYGVRDAMFYALSIGIGSDPMDERHLRFVYEKNLKTAFPTMAAVLGHRGPWSIPDSGIDLTKILHGEQHLTLHQPLPPAATIRASERITGVIDQGAGRGALISHCRNIFDHQTGSPLATLNSIIFCRSGGGFGGPTGSMPSPHRVPETPPDRVVEILTLPQTALIYRLNGDDAAFHVDPDAANNAGFPRPFMHGLCTWGMAAFAATQAYRDLDLETLGGFGARFTAPAFPGEALTCEFWRNAEAISFQVWAKARGAKILDNGRLVAAA